MKSLHWKMWFASVSANLDQLFAGGGKHNANIYTSTITLCRVSLWLFTEQQSGAKNKTVQGSFLNFKKNLLTRLVPPWQRQIFIWHNGRKKPNDIRALLVRLATVAHESAAVEAMFPYDCCSLYMHKEIIHEMHCLLQSSSTHNVFRGSLYCFVSSSFIQCNNGPVLHKIHLAVFWILARCHVTEGATTSPMSEATPSVRCCFRSPTLLNDHLVPNIWKPQ